MTRNSEINCEDLFGCDHEAEVPIYVGGEIDHWRCRCGEKKWVPTEEGDGDAPVREVSSSGGSDG